MSVPIVSLGELCVMDRQGLHPDDPIASGLPFVGVEHVESESGAFNFSNGSRIGSQKSTTFRFDERHVLYAKLRPYLNKVATPEFAGRCSPELIPLLARDGVDREFIAYLLRRKETVDYVMSSVTGARMPRTDMKALMSLRVPLPPLDEQRRIVGILNRAAKIERLRAQAQDLMGEFIPALFVRMFGDPAENPMGWEVGRLGEVCAVVGGGTPRRKNAAYFGGPIPWATPTDVTGLGGLPIESTRETLTETGLHESSARLVPAGTILLTSRATIGYTAIAAVPMATNQGFANLTCQQRLIPEYLACWLRLRRDWLVQLAGYTIFRELPKSTLRKIAIPLPPLARQHRFAGIVRRTVGTTPQDKAGTAQVSALTASLTSRLLDDFA